MVTRKLAIAIRTPVAAFLKSCNLVNDETLAAVSKFPVWSTVHGIVFSFRFFYKKNKKRFFTMSKCESYC